MDINKIFQQVNKLLPNTPLQDVLYYENLIFKKIQDFENEILNYTINYQEQLQNNIFRKEKQLDKLQTIHQDIILSYQKKEAIYKFPEKLINLQNEILDTTRKIKIKKDTLQKHKKHITVCQYNLQQLENKYLELLKKQDGVRFECDMLVSFCEYKFESIEKLYLENLHNLTGTFSSQNDDLNDLILKTRTLQLNLVLEELTSKFKKDKIITRLLTEKNQLFSKIQKDEFDLVKINNYGMQIKLETKIYLQKIKNNIPKIQSLRESNLRHLDTQIKLHQKFKTKKIQLCRSKTGSINSFYYRLENIMSHLKNLEYQIAGLCLTKKSVFNNLNELNKMNDTLTQDIFELGKSLDNLQRKREFMLPGIIKKYNFYMNFYHYDLKENKMHINVLQRDLKYLRNKNVLEQPNISEYYQKINILKKLQEHINKKFYDATTTN